MSNLLTLPLIPYWALALLYCLVLWLELTGGRSPGAAGEGAVPGLQQLQGSLITSCDSTDTQSTHVGPKVG